MSILSDLYQKSGMHAVVNEIENLFKTLSGYVEEEVTAVRADVSFLEARVAAIEKASTTNPTKPTVILHPPNVVPEPAGKAPKDVPSTIEKAG